MFHREIKDGEIKRRNLVWIYLFGERTNDYKNPEEMNEFIKNLMDPFNNSVASIEHDFESYYDEYYALYDIEKDDNSIVSNKEYTLKKLFKPKLFSK
jgi:hypothetical protein